MITELLILFGGIALLVFGLNLISKNSESLAEEKFSKTIRNCVKTPIGGLLTGTVVAGVTQSSLAVSVIAVGLVEVGVISFSSSAAVIMGANIGTTVTAQLISLSGKSGTLIGSICLIIGLLTGFCKNSTLKKIGNAVVGLGVLFTGLSVMATSLKGMVGYGWFKNIFLTDNPFLLFLNGTVLTGITQSSSAITGIIVLLANENLITVKNSAFITLGANIGSCFFVVLSSLSKSREARRSSVFNLLFNFSGALLFFPITYFFGDSISLLLLRGGRTFGKAIADFHTAFNLICALVFFPLLGVFEKIIKKIIPN